MQSISKRGRSRSEVFVLAAGCCLLAQVTCADELVASLRLRGGIDSNPQFSTGQGIGGSAFIGAETALAAGAEIDGLRLAVAAEGATSRYANPGMAPARTGKVVLRGAIGDEALRIDATTSFSDADTYNLRSSDLVQAVKLQARHGDLKLFVTAEGGLSRLNQTNAIFPNFFPVPHRFWRATAIPGVSLVRGKAEFGFSVNLSLRRYAEEFDIFGYRRDNERVEPFVFASYAGDTVTAFASVSRLHGRWHDPDFSDIDRTLYDVSLTWAPKPFTVALTAARRAGETTFPISPITFDTVYSAKASWQIDTNWALNASVGYADTEYLDSDFRARTLSYGVGIKRDLGHDIKLGVDLMRLEGTLISGEAASATTISASLSRRFAPAPAAVTAAAGPKG